MTATPSPLQTAVQTVLQNLGNQLLADATGDASDSLTAFFNSVNTNPTIQNVLAQGAILQATFLLSGPTLEKQAIQQIAQAGLAILAALKANPVTL